MRCVAIVQARLGSTRLPGKVLLPIEGKPMIQHVVERAQAIPGVDKVTLTVPEEDLQEFYLVRAEAGCGLVGGPRDDVLARYVLAAESSNADVIVRITGDCPLIVPEIADEVMKLLGGKDSPYDFASNDTRFSGWPDGLDVEVIRAGLLMEADKRATDPYEREHVTLWMRRQAPFPVLCREADEYSKVKLSVDTQEDLNRVRRIMARIPAEDYSWEATRKAIEEETLC